MRPTGSSEGSGRDLAVTTPVSKEMTEASASVASGRGAFRLLGSIETSPDLLQRNVLLVEAGLPLRWAIGLANLNGRDLVFRTVRCPVRVVGGDDVGAGLRMVECRVDDARLHSLADLRPQCNI